MEFDEIPAELRYTENHLWFTAVSDAVARWGLTEFALSQIGEVQAVVFPEPGETLEAGDIVGEVRGSKSVFDLIAPISGRVIEANYELDDELELLGADPYGEGWLVTVQIGPGDQEGEDWESALLAEEYQDLIDVG